MKRFNIYDNDRLIGQDYQRDNGEWMHKWVDVHNKPAFDRFSWRGRAKGDNMENWEYKEVNHD